MSQSFRLVRELWNARSCCFVDPGELAALLHDLAARVGMASDEHEYGDNKAIWFEDGNKVLEQEPPQFLRQPVVPPAPHGASAHANDEPAAGRGAPIRVCATRSAELTQAIEQDAEKCPKAERLMKYPGVGALTALTLTDLSESDIREIFHDFTTRPKNTTGNVRLLFTSPNES